jgi:hypothetical protein
MALRRQTYIENSRVLTDSGTITSQINVRDPISSIYYDIEATNGASWNQANTIAQNVQALEILDGANVIFSLTGAQLAAKACYDRGFFPYMMIDEMPGSQQSLSGTIQFGRWFGDTSYALDPTKFSNLQMRLTWNLATVRAIGATSFVTGTGRFTALANIMEGSAPPPACLTTRQHYAFTTAAGGVTYVDIPTDRRIKSILVRSAQAVWGGIPGINRVKLTCDQDKFVPFDLLFNELVGYVCNRNSPFMYKHACMLQNTTVFSPVMKYDEQVNFQGYQGDTVLLYTNNGAGFGTVNQLTGGAADANMRSYAANVMGWFPYNTVQIDLGEWDDPASWLDATLSNSIQLQLTNNVANGVASVCLETELVY